MPQWKTDVAVAIQFFNKPSTLKRVFEQVKDAKPKSLFLIADGPRKNVLSDKDDCERCRAIVEDVDWTCDVHKIYNDENMGLFETYFNGMARVFEVVDRCIFMEDDIVVAPSYFDYCKELLDRYEHDSRISFITACNYMKGGIHKDVTDADYFFAGEGAVYTYAFWKRTFELMNMNFIENPYAVKTSALMASVVKPGYDKRIMRLAADPNFQGHIPHTEIHKNLLRFLHHQICIVPAKNMARNIGIVDNATHGTNDLRKVPRALRVNVYDCEVFDVQLPLRHPQYVIEDVAYNKRCQYVIPWNRPLLKFFRTVEAVARHLWYGDMAHVANRAWMLIRGKYHD